MKGNYFIMENNEVKPKNDIKKTLIICGTVLAVVVIALVCVFVLTGKPSAEAGLSGNSGVIDAGDLSFEQFTMGMKQDLPPETMEEVKRLYAQVQKAMEENDTDKMSEAFEELNALDVFDESMMNMDSMEGVIIMDENGNVLDGLPEGAIPIGGGAIPIDEWEDES